MLLRHRGHAPSQDALLILFWDKVVQVRSRGYIRQTWGLQRPANLTLVGLNVRLGGPNAR